MVSICVCGVGCVVQMRVSVVCCVRQLCAAVRGMYRACDGGAIGVLRGSGGRKGGKIGRGVDLCVSGWVCCADGCECGVLWAAAVRGCARDV